MNRLNKVNLFIEVCLSELTEPHQDIFVNVRNPCISMVFTFLHVLYYATSRFTYFERFSLNFSSSSFVIRVNLLHP